MPQFRPVARTSQTTTYPGQSCARTPRASNMASSLFGCTLCLRKGARVAAEPKGGDTTVRYPSAPAPLKPCEPPSAGHGECLGCLQRRRSRAESAHCSEKAYRRPRRAPREQVWSRRASGSPPAGGGQASAQGGCLPPARRRARAAVDAESESADAPKRGGPSMLQPYRLAGSPSPDSPTLGASRTMIALPSGHPSGANDAPVPFLRSSQRSTRLATGHFKGRCPRTRTIH